MTDPKQLLQKQWVEERCEGTPPLAVPKLPKARVGMRFPGAMLRGASPPGTHSSEEK